MDFLVSHSGPQIEIGTLAPPEENGASLEEGEEGEEEEEAEAEAKTKQWHGQQIIRESHT